MKKSFWLIVLFWAALPVSAADYAAVSEDGRVAVATVQPRATEAALEVIAAGGNAVDAAVAATLALGVVDGHNSGIGGGLFALVHWADGTVEAIDGREIAPMAAHRDMYVQDGKVVSQLSRSGPLASGIPGSVAVFDYLLKKGGALKRPQVFAPAISLAERGFAIDGIYARRLVRHADLLAQYQGSREVLLNSEGEPWPAGHVLMQTDLAGTYKAIAEYGSDYFYKGEFAKKAGEWMAANGGIITAKDFADYQLLIRNPVRSHYRGYEVIGFGPPSSGGVHVAQILNILAEFDLAKASAAERYHLLAEAMKLAFADRAHWLGDPAYSDVPKGLISPQYAQKLAAKIESEKALVDVNYNTPENAKTDLFDKHTTHIATADKQGNWVAITTTVNTDFGSKVIIPGTGVVMNNQMDDFTAQPGVANMYGLMGSEANSIAPGKRPLSSMSPTLVLKAGKPVMTLGAAGGPTIISQVVQTLVQTIDLDLPLSEALAAPRIHHQWRPDKLFVEKTLSETVTDALAARGHTLDTLGPYGSTQAISINADGEFEAVAEPRLIERNRP
ncbi:MAG TPA: gamma-glutamyltransferase [Cellvibrionaceae bacterium]